MNKVLEQADKLLDNIYTAVLVFDEDLELMDVNTAAENMFSNSQRKMCGHNAYELLPHCTNLIENMQRAVRSRQPYMEWGLALVLPSNRSLTVDCMVSPMLDGDDCSGLILEIIDSDSYTRVVRENNLAAVHDAARKSITGMAHEIKNPLGGLRGAAQLLESELNDDGLKEYTQIIISEADRLRNLVDRMLTPSAKHNNQSINIHEIIEYVCSVVIAESDNQLEIERDYDPSLPQLTGDRDQLIQAIMNIVNNASQAVDSDGSILIQTRIKRRCTIRHETWKLVVQIEVTDSGPGVPEEIADQIFYPMVTGRAEGTGLGLSIAQSLLQAHNGMIEYERLDDKSCFRILLPVEQ